LLLDRNRRVSEVAYDVGFQSLTHFNRIFRKIAGQSPTNYRRSSTGREYVAADKFLPPQR